MKICTIIGARPQFIKAAMVSKAIREYNSGCHSELKAKNPVWEILVHTGQHYDYQMSQVFFDQLDIPNPEYHLGVGSGEHGEQTGKMLVEIEKVLLKETPDVVLVYGDTNSTLAGALAAVKLHIPVGHVEGGMRSFNRSMPEEINRVLTDHVAKWHFCATETAVNNLKKEGITEGVHLVGDVMYEAVMQYKDVAGKKSTILEHLGLNSCHPERGEGSQGSHGIDNPLITKYALATLHRAENTDDPNRLRNILEALVEISKEMPVVLPLHPRTRQAIKTTQLDVILSPSTSLRVNSAKNPGNTIPSPLAGEGQGEGDKLAGVIIIKPVSYLDMLQLEQNASIILTDSGGMQKEAFWLGVPCITMRDETEWVETVEAGWNKVVGANKTYILDTLHAFEKNRPQSCHGRFIENASQKIVSTLVEQ